MKAHLLSERLQWPLVNTMPSTAVLVLLVEPNYLALYLPRNAQFKPLYLNFAEGKQAYRLRHVQQEQLVKACRVKNLERPLTIIDATAGLGRDSLLLAASGACVTMLEQVPVLSLLLEDLLARLSFSEWTFDLHLAPVKAEEYLQALTEADRPDVIYLDPMFAHDATKTALVKKDLQMLQVLAAPPNLVQQAELLTIACARARYKVIVKRAKLADPLANAKPSYALLGSHSRFDVYVSEDRRQINLPFIL